MQRGGGKQYDWLPCGIVNDVGPDYCAAKRVGLNWRVVNRRVIDGLGDGARDTTPRSNDGAQSFGQMGASGAICAAVY